jgi:alkylhydroperoxidase/carboxymuconolactone decarboxylase family protein YurZ
MSAANMSESAVQPHTHRALDADATSEKIEHTLLLGINTLGFSTIMDAITWAKAVVDAVSDNFFILL